jgi:hypothetical protein
VARRRRSLALTVILMLAAGYLLYLAVPSAVPASRAARGDGTPGVFTARRVECVRHPGHRSCSWTGDFRTDDGETRRAGVSLSGADPDSLRAGGLVRAFDTGRSGRVYASANRRELVTVALMITAATALLALAAVRLRGAARGGSGSRPHQADRDEESALPRR